MKICVIAVDKEHYTPRRVFEEAKNKKHEVFFTTWSELDFFVKEDGFEIKSGSNNLGEFDAIFCRNARHVHSEDNQIIDNRYLLRILKMFCDKNGIYLFNRNFSLMNKFQQQVFLSVNDIPTLTSYFSKNKKRVENFKINFPVIAKPLEGSSGRGIFKLKNLNELNSFFKDEYESAHYEIQEYYEIKSDLRVLFLGGKILGVMERIPAKGKWITNYSAGGSVDKGNCDSEIKQITKKVVEKTGLSYAGVDILKDDKQLRVIEINEFAQFEGFERAFPEINVGEKIIKYIEQQVLNSNN
ncbi:MAG: RimK family alpha-L-glutamate ligase [Candidatus Moraniibacteriota bacterium]